MKCARLNIETTSSGFQGPASADRGAPNEHTTTEYEWETVPDKGSTGAVPESPATEDAGPRPDSSLPIGLASAAQIRAFMSKLPPKVSTCLIVSASAMLE